MGITKKNIKKNFIFLLSVCIVFSNIACLETSNAFADTSEGSTQVIERAELFDKNTPIDVVLKKSENDAVTCVCPDKQASPQIRVYTSDNKYSTYYVEPSHWDESTNSWTKISTLKKKLSQKNGENYGALVFTLSTVKKYVQVGSLHKFKLDVYESSKATQPVDGETYYFNLIRSVGLAFNSPLTATDENENELNVTKQADRNQYNITCDGDILNLTCNTQTPNSAKIKIDGEEVASGEEKKIDLTRYKENDKGQKEITLLVEYTGKEGTGEGTTYKIIVEKTNYTPQVTTVYSGAEPIQKDVGIGNTSKAIDCEKEKTVTMRVDVTVPDGSSLSYQWHSLSNQNGSSSWADKAIENATEAEYSIPTKYAGNTIYYCKVTNTVNETKFIIESEKCMVRVKPTYASPAKIISQPTSAEVLKGQTSYNLTVVAESMDLGGEPKYQWYISESKDTTSGTAVENGDKATVTVDASNEGTYYYYCAVSNSLEKEDGTVDTFAAVYTKPIEVKVIDTSTLFEGKGTESEPFLIKNDNDFVKIKENVAKGNSFADTYFKIMPANGESIEMPGLWESIGTLKDGFTETKQGTGVLPFSGHLDGNGCKIVIPEGGKPLFRYVRDAYISNLNIYGEKIDGAGLIDEYFIDYGEDGNYNTGVPNAVTIDKVTLLSGSKTKKSGLIHGNASGKNNIYITNSVVEENVIIGCEEKESAVGSFAGCLNGSIINCKSAAKVYGVSSVGGIAGEKGQSMGICSVLNCEFTGEVHASENYAGGMIGSGYDGKGTAPNTPVVSIRNCLVSGTIEGKNKLGGILGGEPGCENCWANGSGGVTDNVFCGSIPATEENATVGAIVGFMKSYNTNQEVNSNYFLDTCGAMNGVGAVEIVHDSDFDITKTGTSVTAEALKDKSVVEKLNSSSTSYKNWIQGENHPIHSREAVLYEIELSGTYKTNYKTGDTFSTDGMVITGKLSDGSTRKISLSDENLKFTGFKSNQRGVQTITVTYGVAKATYDVTVLYNESQVQDISVYFTLLGDTKHDTPTAATGTHTLSAGNLQTWIPRKKVEINNNTTVYDVFKQVLTANNITWRESAKLGTVYIESLNKDGVDLGEFDNGPYSGWMYTLNGTHPLLGVAQQFLNNGDNIVFHYTDDYTKEEGSDKWDIPGQETVTEVTTSGSSGSATTTAPTEVTVSGNTATATVKSENAAEAIKQAKEKKSAEIVLNVAASDTKGAETVRVQLDTATVKSVVSDTDASLTVKTENGRVSLDREALTTIASEAKGTTITLEVVKVDKPTETQQKAAGTNGQVLQLVVKSGDKIISDFNKGKATVTVEIPAKLRDKKVAAIHIAEDGKIEQMSGKTVKINGKDYYTFETPHFSAFALVDAEELGLEAGDEEANIERIKELVSSMSLKASSSKTSKKNIKVTLTGDKSTSAAIKEIKEMGYTVKYKYYRSTKKASKYQARITKTTKSFINTAGKKGTKYYYKARIQVYDKDGNLVAQTLLKQCKYAARKWTK